MTTNTAPASPPARQDPRQVLNTLTKTVNFGDVGIGTGVAFANSLPAGAFIVDVMVEVVTAFNAVTTNVLTVGTNATSYNNMVNSADVNEAVTGVYIVGRGLGRSLAAAAEVTPFVMYTQTGTAATTGQAVVVITYTGGFVS